MSKPSEKVLVGAALMFVPGGGVLASFARLAGANLLLAGGAQALQKSPRRKNPTEKAIEVNATGEDAPIYRVYGECKVGGNLVMLGTSGAGNRYLHYAVVHSVSNGCGIEGLYDLWLNDRKIDDADIDSNGDVIAGDFAGLVNVRSYVGLASQAPDETLRNALPYADSNSRGDYIAYTAITFYRGDGSEEMDQDFQKAFDNGAPSVQRLVRGQKVYDPRKDSTNGGSGSHRLNDPNTWEYSRNRILCALDYALAPEELGGVGVDSDLIDWAAAAASASICDELLTVPDGSGGTTQIARYTLDFALDTNENTQANLDKILAGCFGAVVSASSRLKFYAGAFESPSETVDKNWIAGGVSVRRLTAIGEAYNAVRSTFIDPFQNYQNVKAWPFTNAAYEVDDGGDRLWKDVEWAGVQDRYYAQANNITLGKMSRNQKMVIAQLNMQGLDLEPWEIVNLDLPDLNVSGTFRVATWDLTDIGPRVTFEEVAPTTYDVDVSDLTEIPVVLQPGETFETPSAPTGLTATATIDGIALKWTNPGLSEFSEIEVHRSTSSGGTYTKIAEGRINAYTDAVTDGATYYYKVRARHISRQNRFSDFSATVNATAKHVADYQGGRGVNGAHPRYSTFEELSLPPFATNKVSVGHFSGSNFVYHGSKSIVIERVSGSGSLTYAFLSSSTTDYNLSIPPGRYIISIRGREASTNSVTGNKTFLMRLRNSNGVYRTSDVLGPLTFSPAGRYSFVVDTSSDNPSTLYNLSLWFMDPAFSSDTLSIGDRVFLDAVMIEEQYGNATTPSAYVPPVTAAGSTGVAADSGQVADHRSLRQTSVGNAGSLTNGSPLTATDLGGTARIDIAAFAMQYGFGAVAYNAGSISGVPSQSARIVYGMDRYFMGGAIEYTHVHASSRALSVASPDYISIGGVTTPVSGGGGTTQPPPGSGGGGGGGGWIMEP